MGVAPIADRGMLTAFSLKTFLNELVERESFIAEGTIKGLFLLRRPAVRDARHPNRACWVLRWSDNGKRRKKLVIGDARTISLDVARKAVQTHLANIVQGGDPAEERRARRSRKTVSEVWAASLLIFSSRPNRQPRATTTPTVTGCTSQIASDPSLSTNWTCNRSKLLLLRSAMTSGWASAAASLGATARPRKSFGYSPP